MSQEKPLISIVVPILNEIGNLDELYQRINAVMCKSGYPFEVIITDNGSTDNTRSKLREIVKKDPHWKALFLSRNFGHQNSLFCGLEHARGEAIISLDGDLQDPPEIILDLIAKWQQGAQVVSTIRASRKGEPLWRLTLINLFYKILSIMSGQIIFYNSGDYRLMSRRVLSYLLDLEERTLFIRGLVPLLGFKQEQIEYHREGRADGESKMNFFKLTAFALDGLITTTVLPLRIATFIGFASLLFSIIYGMWRVFFYFTFKSPYVPGWTTIVVLITAFSGIMLLTLGIIGEYVGKIFNEVKKRPRYIIEEHLENSNPK